MKFRKKSKSGEESYWKSFTDIMSGLLLIILLILMLLLLYMTQMNKKEYDNEHKYDYSQPYDSNDDLHDSESHKADELYDRPPTDGGAGGGGGGEDDPGTATDDGINNDVGHDKCAVFVTVVDEETGKTIKKEGILFELYRGETSSGALQTLHTYYPTKVAYKKFETTEAGVFYLPEKITLGWYTLHNIRAPKGYSFAEDVSFEITESRDWTDPYRVIVPMSPSKSVIYINDIDADSKQPIPGGVYEVYAAADIVTLDGTLRHKEGDLVGKIKCDENGKGASKKLYLGDYNVVQKSSPKYYAVNTTPLKVKLDYLDTKDKVYTIENQKTAIRLTLVDEETKAPIPDAVYSVTGRDDITTNSRGSFRLTDLDKEKSYTVTLSKLPEHYRTAVSEVTFEVDKNGLIKGKAVIDAAQTAYIIRLQVSAKDMLFGSELSSGKLRLYGKNDEVIEEWTATGEPEEFLDLEPGNYTLEANGDASNRQSILLKDAGGVQKLETKIWTILDTLAVIGAALIAVGLIALLISVIRSRRKRKKNEE